MVAALSFLVAGALLQGYLGITAFVIKRL